MHTACYSPREGTVSATWPDDVPQEVKEERLHRVEALQEPIATRRNAAFMYTTVEVLIEDSQSARKNTPQWRGRTRSGKLVYLPREAEDRRGQLLRTRVVKTSPWALQSRPGIERRGILSYMVTKGHDR